MDGVDIIGMGISLEHQLLFIVHPDLLCHVDRCSIGWINQGNQPLDAKGRKCKITDSAGSFVFGSELKTITSHPGFQRRIDPLAVEEYFSLGYVADPITNAQYPIPASTDGRVIGMAVDQVVMAGFAAYHIGTEAEVPGE